MMSQNRTKKLIQYLSEMKKREDEYDIDPFVVFRELEKSDSDTSEKIERIYDAIAGERICKECEERKFFDEKGEEYYCPVHG